MIAVRKAGDRGHAQHGWLDSRHTFSFADYYDPAHMGFRDLRVINEDRVAPGMGFDPHSHRDMEILSYILEGAVEHKDSMENGSVIRPGDVQRMSAGTGVTHSEYNPSKTEPVHFLQIWIVPRRAGLPPSYAQQHVAASQRRSHLRLLVSPDGRDGSLSINQDVDLYGTILDPGEAVSRPLRADRHAWVQVARGSVAVNGVALTAGDGVALTNEPRVDLSANTASEVLVFDLR